MNLNEETIIKAYSMGIFPMSENYNDPNIYWINPKKRGVIPIDKFKISKSLKKKFNFYNIITWWRRNIFFRFSKQIEHSIFHASLS